LLWHVVPDGQAPALHIVDVGEHSAVPDAQLQPSCIVVGLRTRLQTIPVPHPDPPHIGTVPHPALGSVVVVVPPATVVVVVPPAAVVVVIGRVGVVVVVVVAGQLGPLPGAGQASQQLVQAPTVPCFAVQCVASFLILHLVPLWVVTQQVTAPGLPQVECAAHRFTAPLQLTGSTPLVTSVFA